MKIRYNDCNLNIGAVYGPNVDNDTFFRDITLGINQMEGDPIVLGGDWNATVSDLPVNENLDVFNMRSIPSLTRTHWLNDLINANSLIDIF